MEVTGLAAPLVVLAFIVFIWLLPIIIIISSERTTGGEKAAWVFYMLLAPIKNRY